MIAVFPDLARALIASWLPSDFEIEQPFDSGMLTLLVRSLSVSVAVVYLMWRSGLSLGAFGLKPIRFRIDVVLALAALLVLLAADMALSYALWPLVWIGPVMGLEPIAMSDWAPPHGSAEVGLLVIVMIASAFAEEVAMRGYLITRLTQLLGASWKAVIVSSALFASYHVYNGWVAPFHVFGIGVVFGVLFLLFRRVWPLVAAHAALNIIKSLAFF